MAEVDLATHAYPGAQGPLQFGVTKPEVFPKAPAEQDPLHEAEVMAATAPYWPALQLVHAGAPERLYFPAGQTTATSLTLPKGHA